MTTETNHQDTVTNEIFRLLSEVCDYDGLLNVHLLLNAQERHTIEKQESNKIIQDMRNSVDILEKKISNIENEINAIKVSHTKNNEKYKRVNSERLKLVKKCVELESVYSDIKNSIEEYDMLTQKYNDELRILNKPSYNQFYLELINKFGVEFVNDRKHVCKIRNNKKKCLVEIELDKSVSDYKLCSEIWNNIN